MTTPLVVTVGLSLTIPLSLIGEILQYQQYSSFTYWVGAVVVFVSFIVVSRESHDEDDLKKDDDLERSVGA
jgi:solute carrier family 35 protein F5